MSTDTGNEALRAALEKAQLAYNYEIKPTDRQIGFDDGFYVGYAAGASAARTEENEACANLAENSTWHNKHIEVTLRRCLPFIRGVEMTDWDADDMEATVENLIEKLKYGYADLFQESTEAEDRS